MSKVKEYLCKLDHELSPDFFTFYCFYNNPIEYLNDEFHLHNFVGNKKYFYFLELCLSDTTFIKKISNNEEVLIRIKIIIEKSLELFNLGVSYNDLDAFYDATTGQDGLNLLSIYGVCKYNYIVNYLKDNAWIFEYNNNFNEINPKLLRRLLDEVKKLINGIKSAEYSNKLSNDIIFYKIINDDYSVPTSCYLFNKNGADLESFSHLVCNNSFLDVLNKHLINKKLDGNIINNILCILRLSVDIVSNYDIYALDVPWLKDKIDVYLNDRLSDFNISYCLSLIYRFEGLKKKSKIIYLNY